MIARIPEMNKKPGVCYAVTDDGLELPIIDITHPAFAVDISPQELTAIEEATLRHLQKSSRMPGFLLRYYARHSIIMRNSMQAAGGFLSGIGTYLQKLGPENLGRGYAGRIDRKLVSSIAPVSGRMRLRDMARLIADGLAPALTARQRGPVHLLNIGGGTASDSLNGLILIRKEHPHWLDGHSMIIHVLDLDASGPRFGSRALDALRANGGPLTGLDAILSHIKYDWSDVSVMRKLIGNLDAESAVVVGSSEGGLFEYGSDEDIIANLEILRDGTPADFVMIGSVIRDSKLTQVMKDVSKMTIQPRKLAEFTALAARGGWAVDKAIEGNPFYYILNLKKD